MACSKGPTICVYEGDTYALSLVVSDSDGVIDITDWEIYFTAKQGNEEDPSIAINGAVTDGPAGEAVIQLTSTHTDTAGNYRYFVELNNADSSIVKTFRGALEIGGD